MAIITEITPQAKDKTRVNVYLDGRFCCGLDFVTLAEYRLKKGMEITEETLAEIQLSAEKDKAFSKAMSLLSVTGKTEKEMYLKLKEKGYAPAIIRETIAKLKEYGYVDNAEYAREYVASHANKKGGRMLAAELKMKGVSDADISSALKEVDESEGACAALNKYMRGKEITFETLQKAYRYLLSKGFSGDSVGEAMQTLKEQVAGENSDV
ncbi:MAG: RecX family transcriptional regulator [Clostridia bacterium]|nr:RecX family transcriptional regulator [Clostridia bacterium]